MKRVLIIFSAVIVVCLVVFGVYYFFFTNEGSSQNPISEYLPFGQPENSGGGNPTANNNFVGPDGNNFEDSNNTSTSTSEERVLEDFLLLNSTPVAGFRANTNPETGTTTIRYVEKDQGYVYETELQNTRKTRISDTEIPDVYDAYWSGSGNQFVARYLTPDNQTIKDYLVDLTSYTPSEDYTLDGNFLEDDIQDVALRPGSGRALYLNETENGSLVSRLNFSSGESVNLFTSDFSEWDIEWPSANTIAFTTKPSQEFLGYLYRLSIGSDKLVKVLDQVRGLTTLVSPDFNYVLYSESTRGSFNFYLYNTQTKDSRIISQKTLPEKCVWETSQVFYCAVPTEIPSATYPDDRYQGQVDFTDRIMRFNVNNPGNPEVYELDSPVDATHLSVSGNYIFFLGRENSYLWARRISEEN